MPWGRLVYGGGLWAWSQETLVLTLPFLLPRCVTLSKSSSISWHYPSPLKWERFIPKDAGGMASCSNTPWLLIWGKKKQLLVNHRFGIHLLETCQEIRLMTCWKLLKLDEVYMEVHHVFCFIFTYVWKFLFIKEVLRIFQNLLRSMTRIITSSSFASDQNFSYINSGRMWCNSRKAHLIKNYLYHPFSHCLLGSQYLLLQEGVHSNGESTGFGYLDRTGFESRASVFYL